MEGEGPSLEMENVAYCTPYTEVLVEQSILFGYVLYLPSAKILADGLYNLLQHVLRVIYGQDVPSLGSPVSYVHHHTV